MKSIRRCFVVLASVLVAAISCPAQVELISGFNFGQFVFTGSPSTDGLNGSPAGFIRSNFARDVAPGPSDSGIYHVDNGIEAPFSAGVAALYFDGSNASSAWDFVTGTDVSVVERGSLVAVNHNLVNGAQMFIGDDNNAGLRFNATGSGNTDFSIVIDTTGWSDFDPAAFSQPNDFNLTFSAYAYSGASASIQWFFNDAPVGAAITVAPGEFQAFNLDLPAGFYGRADATLVARVTGDLVIDHVQINGVRATAATFTQQPVSQTVTAGADVSFSVAVGGAATPTYQWRFENAPINDGPGVSGATTATLTLTGVGLARAGSYTVVVNNNGTTAESDPGILTVQTVPVITEPPASASANPGEAIVFEVDVAGVPAPTFEWRRDGVLLADDGRITGATTATLSIAALTAADEGAYIVRVINAAGFADSTPAILTITEESVAPTIQQEPVSTTVVVGNVATFRVNASGAPAPTFQWFKGEEPLADGPGISGATTATLRVTPSSLAAAGAYRVVVTNPAGFVESVPVTLTVQSIPSIPAGSGPVGQSLNVGGRLVLSVSAEGTPAPTFQWRKNGEDLPGETGAELVVNPVTTETAGDYTVVVTNAAGSVESDVAGVVIIQTPFIITPPVGATVGAGGTVTLSVVAGGSPELTYQWRKDGEDLPDQVAATLNLENVQIADAGAYTVVVANAGGSVESEPAMVAVALRVVRSTSVQRVPPGTQLVIDSNFAPDGGYRFQWLRNGAVVRGATASTLLIDSARFADGGTYAVRIYSAAGRLLATRTIARLAVSVGGIYESLVRDPESLSPVGRVGVNIAANGTFTASLVHEDGKTYAFKGRFAFTEAPYLGDATAVIRRSGGQPSFEVDLLLDARENTLEIGLGSVGVEAPQAVASTEPRLATSERPAWLGTYALSLAPRPTELPDQPTSTAVLKAVVAKQGGLMKITGRLADGTAISASVNSSVDADYAVWLKLYSGKGYLGGDLSLEEISPGAYAANAETGGDFVWFRAPNVKSKVFPGGIDLLLEPTLAKP